MAHLKENPECVTVNVPATGSQEAFDLTVKRPASQRDDISIPFDLELLDKVINYVRAEGFDRGLKRPADIPKNVHRRSDCKHPFQYMWTDADGKKSRHFATSLDAAIEGVKYGPPEDESPEGSPEGLLGEEPEGLAEGSPEGLDGQQHPEDSASDAEPAEPCVAPPEPSTLPESAPCQG